MTGNGYDIIGDIHGCHQTLEAMLAALGYRRNDGVFRHSTRQVLFLGDFIDRGPGQREVIDIVRPMVESGTARAVMGNHEFNAIAWATQHPSTGEPLRRHSDKNRRQHGVFLDAYEADPTAWRDVIDWFRTLPLWLDLGPLRLVHACWDTGSLDLARRALGDGGLMNHDFLVTAATRGTPAYDAVEILLKGKEVPLPEGAVFHDKDGNPRRHIRVKWWQRNASFRDAFLGPENAVTHIPEDPIHGDHLLVYGHDEPPVFIGHYWLEGEPTPLAPNIACLDYSVAKPGGKLTAYRWDGEAKLVGNKFFTVDRLESAPARSRAAHRP